MFSTEKEMYNEKCINNKCTGSYRTLFSGLCCRKFGIFFRTDSGRSSTGEVAGPDIAAQAEQSCKNVKAVIEAAGSDISKVFKTTCFLADMADFATFNSVYEKYFTSKPARSCVAVKTLPKNVLCEIEAIAEL